MIKIIRDHQLSTALLVALVAFQIIAGILRPDPFSADHWSTLLMGASDGVLTAFILIVFGENLRERGSEQGLD